VVHQTQAFYIFQKYFSALQIQAQQQFCTIDLSPFRLPARHLPKGDYNMTEFNIQYNSDNRKAWVYDIFAVTGQFYNGWKHTYRAGITYRAQPWGNFRAGVEHNDIRFPGVPTKIARLL
jgi:hypothetical protein